jgi:glutamine---fructose-6-phosphate transaminase (isomerizing)
MCGIVGYIGPKQAYPILINGLKRLEYRGYDSAGISIINGTPGLIKCKGKISDLETHVDGSDISGTIGIGHTRWATHGEPNDINAHPHVSENGSFYHCSQWDNRKLRCSQEKSLRAGATHSGLKLILKYLPTYRIHIPERKYSR